MAISTQTVPPLRLGRLRARGVLAELGAQQLRFSDAEAAERDRPDRAEVMARMPIDERFLVEYLWDEVAARQDPAVQEFLMLTAVLDRLSGPLCDAVTGRRDSARVLDALEQGNVFVIPLDPERRWPAAPFGVRCLHRCGATVAERRTTPQPLSARSHG